MNVFTQVPSQQRVTISGANVDRFVTTLLKFREQEQMDPMDELVTLIKATEQFSASDVRMMCAIMLLREADRQ